jgi:branched-chain amino acid transport system substrate-binding protein
MRQTRKTILSAACGLGLLAASFASSHAEDIRDINIALITPMSGPSMGNQEPAVNSYKLAIDEINRKGIVIGNQKYRLNVQWFDEECKPSVAVTAARAALAQVRPMTVMWAAMCSSSALASRQILLDSKIVALNSVSGTSGFVGPPGNPMLFKNKEEFDWRARDMTRYLAAHNLKHGVILSVNSDWGYESTSMFTKYAAQAGIEIQKTLSFDEHTEEFFPLLAQANQSRPDFIFMASQQLDEQVGFIRAYRELGLEARLVGESTWTEDVAEKTGWSALNGMLTASSWLPTSSRPEVQDYVNKYRSLYGSVPGFNGPPAYDVAKITVQAIEKAGSLDSEKIREVLRTSEFTNLVYGSGTLRFDDRGQAVFNVGITVFDSEKRQRVAAP